MTQMSERALRIAIRQATEESLHYAREAQKLERQLFALMKAKASRRALLQQEKT